ncbi:hypothetical protein KHQ81_01795 [Mycoplasmatota bacterium]|nr:hypothetical protein KHQ81_01795 [Mycoplasmatota bacterium]
MDHIVYLDAKAKELENLLNHKKSMVIRGAAGRKLPYGRVREGDVLYFINNNAEGYIRAKGTVKYVFHSEKMDKETSIKLIEDNQDKLLLSDKQYKRWAGKRYIVLIDVDNICEVEPFKINKTNYSNMDDWLLVEDINTLKIN